MDWLNKVVMVIFGILLLAGITVLFAFAMFWVMLLLGIMVLAWAVGVPLIIKQGGQRVGYVRWFKYHKV